MAEVEAFHAADADEWRAWLAEHGTSVDEVWLVLHHKASGTPSVRYAEAVEQALCFGWIDGHHRPRDESSSQLRFTPRGPRSSWSAVNRARAQAMIDQGLMTAVGRAVIDRAQADGMWEVVGDAARDEVQAELDVLLDEDDAARAHFDRFPPSSKRLILDWIASAKRPDTRQRRLRHTADLAADDVRANHPGAPGISAR